MHERADALEAEVLALHATEDARARRPTPLDEVETALEVFRRSLLEVTPQLYRTLEDALERGSAGRGGCRRSCAGARGSAATATAIRTSPRRSRAPRCSASAQTRARRATSHDVEELGRVLSMSALRARGGSLDELMASIEHDRERLPEVAAHARPRTVHEPWREKLWYVQARLRATLEHARATAYVDAARYRARSRGPRSHAARGRLRRRSPNQELRDALRRVDVFGFHLASLDLRQHSGVHDRVVGELLARGGRPGYLELDEAGRRARARRRARAADRAGARPRGADRRCARAACDARCRRARAPRARAARVRALRHVSFTRESRICSRSCSSRAPRVSRPASCGPVPLLEQLEDLDRAERDRDAACSRNPVLRTELGGELEVMVGYSDSGKQVGYVASSMALRRAQLALAEVASERGRDAHGLPRPRRRARSRRRTGERCDPRAARGGDPRPHARHRAGRDRDRALRAAGDRRARSRADARARCSAPRPPSARADRGRPTSSTLATRRRCGARARTSR